MEHLLFVRRGEVLRLSTSGLVLLLALVITLVITSAEVTVAAPAQPPPRQAQTAPKAPPTEAADIPSARSTARLTGRRIEALSERTENSTTAVNADGTVTTDLHAAPMRVKRGDAWIPVDLTLAPADGAIRAKAHPRELVLAAGGTDGPVDVATVKHGDKEVALRWQGKLPVPKLSGDTATYRDVRPGVHLVIRATRTGFAPSLEGEKAEFSFQTKGVQQKADSAVSLWDGPVASSAADPAGRTLRVGGSRKATSNLRFDLSPLHGKRVLGARLWLYGTHSESCVARPWEVWDADRRVARVDTARGFGAGCEDDWVTADVPALAQRAADRRDGVAAIELRAADDPLAYQEFSAADGAGVPHLEVTYNTAPAPASGLDVSDRGDGGGVVYTRTTTPTLSFRPSDPDGDQVSAIFYVYEGNSVLTSHLVPNVVSGSLVSWTVPHGLLHNSKSYRFRAATYDGSDVGDDAWLALRDHHNPNLVAEPENCAMQDGAKVLLANANGSVCQQYVPLPRDGYQMLLNRGTHRVVDNTGCGTSDGHLVGQTTGTWGDCQLWKLEPQSDGVHQLTVKNAGKVLDQGCGAVGRQLSIKVRTGSGCERWTLDLANPDLVQWLPFTVNVQAPAPPIVISADYPSDSSWHRGAGQPGLFTFAPVAGTTGVTKYVWGLDVTPTTEVAAGPDGKVTVSATPATDGVHVLHVRVKNVAGQLSGITSYAFNVGRAGLVLPVEGARVFRRAKLQFQAEPVFTYVKFVYRRGPGAPAEHDVPAANLGNASGGGFGSGFVPISGLGGFAVWSATDTLGTAAGVVQIKAVLATDAGGTGGYPTAWRTVVIDPNADGAASTSVGPGSVNLQTGDYTVSGQDAEEFGLSVSRTASSRDPKAGYQAQHERLSQNQQQINQDTGGFEPRSTSLRRATDRGRSGTDSLELTPTSSGTDTFATVGPEHGALRFGMQPGNTYRFSTWIYVPAATGLSPPDERGLKLVATAHTSSGYTTFSSNRPTVTDAWVELTVDIPVPHGADMAYLRIYNGFPAGSGKKVNYDDLSLREIIAPFGPQWSSGAATDASGVDYTRLTFPQSTSARLEDAAGSSTWFTKAADGKFTPEPGAEGLTLAADGQNFKLTELDGTVSIFSRQTGDSSVPYLLSTTTPPATASVTQFRYEFVRDQVRLKRVIAPVEPGIGDCAAATPARGCEALEYEYTTTTTATSSAFGDFRDRVRAIKVWSTDPTNGAVSAMEISRYHYDDRGRLREVWDPRGGASTPKLRYDYDDAGRVSQLTPGDELPWRFDYGAAGNDDPNAGRLLRARRETLRQGSADQVDGEITSTLVYGVPLDRPSGGPYNLTGSWVATWGQDEAPTDATALFGPEDPVTVNTATATTPGSTGYRAATVHYLDASGREVNTAAPNGEIDSTSYDRFGNAVRILEATNRALALGQLPDAREKLSELGLLQYDTKARSTWLDTRSTFSADGIDQLSSRGPVHRVVLPERPDTLVSARLVSETRYDEGKPDSAAYHLPTSGESYAEIVGELGKYDSRTTTTQYAPAIGGTSGWTLRTATKVTANADRPNAMSAQVRYDPSGRALESRKVGAPNGADVRTTKSVFYTATQNFEDAACGNRPEWAGQACVTKAAGKITGHDPARMTDELPVKRVLAYDRFGEPTVVAETVAGVTRTTETTYDSLGRVLSAKITGGLGTAIPEVRNTYHPISGESVRTEYAGGAAVTRDHDRLGRLIRYTDADGGWTANEYDRFNKPSKVTDSLGTTQTFTYDRTKEPRGFLTSFQDSVAGVLEPTYGPDGQLTSFTMPGGVRMVQQFDPAGTPVLRKYERDSTLIAGSAVLENVHGQTVRHTTPGSDKRYGYDDLGRLSRVADTSLATGLCTVRGYTYDQRANRTGKTIRRGETAATCPDDTSPPQTSTTHTHDTADRLTDPGWVYDAFGRITTTATGLTNTFHVNDLVASQTFGKDRKAWTLDPKLRFRSFKSEKLVNGAWANAVTKVNHYGDDSDEPRWIAEDVTLPDEVTRNIEGPDDDLAVTTGRTGNVVLQMTSLHGDVMATAPVDDGTLGAITVLDNDEFGIPSAETPAAGTARYGWLGGKQRSAEALGGVILMGVRLYHPETGQFLSVDPVPGGSVTAYDYCAGDPVNCTDLDGRSLWSWIKRNVAPVVAKVAEVASYVPGPIGVVAGAVSAGAYAVSGNHRKAKEMAIHAVASLVPGGKFIAKAISAVAKAARPIAKAAKAQRATGTACRIGNSFVAGTPVLLADGTTLPIDDLREGDLVAATDPVTGNTVAQPVVGVIVGYGAKHLVEVGVGTGAATQGTFTTTGDHPIYVPGRGWVKGADLRSGDAVLLPGGTTASVRHIGDLGVRLNRLVYNLNVAALHTYSVVAGGISVLVHNASCVTANRRAGKIAEGRVARVLAKKFGRANVESQVFFRTPFGRRFADFRVSGPRGRFLVEVKAGKSRYTPLQRVKDRYIQRRYGLRTYVYRR